MKTINPKRHHPNTPYHQNDSLLLQFILADFLDVFLEIKQLHSETHKFLLLLNKNSPVKTKRSSLQSLIKITEFFSGGSYSNMRIFSWSNETGSLGKLNHYCGLFSKQAPEFVKEAQKIYTYTNQSWLISIQLHDILLSIKSLTLKEWQEYFALIESLEKKIYSKMLQVSNLIPQIIKKYSQDENVIFSFLKHQKMLDHLFYDGYTKVIIKKTYNGGVEELKNLLIEKYQARGFNQLLPVISKKIQLLQG